MGSLRPLADPCNKVAPNAIPAQAAGSSNHAATDGGDSDHVFALCSLLGFQFAPRIPDLKSRRLYRCKASAYPSLEPLIAGRINVALIRAHWSEILRVAASIRTGTVTASLILHHGDIAPTTHEISPLILLDISRCHAKRVHRCTDAP